MKFSVTYFPRGQNNWSSQQLEIITQIYMMWTTSVSFVLWHLWRLCFYISYDGYSYLFIYLFFILVRLHINLKLLSMKNMSSTLKLKTHHNVKKSTWEKRQHKFRLILLVIYLYVYVLLIISRLTIYQSPAWFHVVITWVPKKGQYQIDFILLATAIDIRKYII